MAEQPAPPPPPADPPPPPPPADPPPPPADPPPPPPPADPPPPPAAAPELAADPSPGSGAARAVGWLLAALVVAAGVWFAVLTAHGGKLFMVETPSMARTAPVGTLVVTEKTAPADLHVGDVITFRPPSNDRVYTHRIVEVTDKGLRTKGDLNAAPDGWVVPADRVIGRAAHLWTGLGWLLRCIPWLLAGGLLTLAVRSRVKERNKAPVSIAGASLTASLALLMVRPLVRAETIGFVPVGTDGVKISAVATGLLPIRVSAPDGAHADLVAGQLGWIETHQPEGDGRYQVLPTLHLPWWGWVLMGLVCALPLLASLVIKDPADDTPDDTIDGASGPGAVVSTSPDQQDAPPPARVLTALRRAARPLTVVLSSLALAAGISPTSAALTARITNSTDTARSRQFFTCLDAMRFYQPASGTLQLLAGYAGGDGTGVPGTQNQSMGVKSSAALSPSNVTQTTGVGCLSDASKRGQQALTLNGSTSKLDVSNAPSISLVNGQPQNGNRQTIMTWFRTTTTRGGVLGCLATSSSVCSGRTLYMGASGRVHFGVGTSTAVSSPTALNDGTWHFVIAQLDSDTGSKLWVDGALVASNANAKSSNGDVVYPQFGYSAGSMPAGFTDIPASQYFAGDMQFFGVYGGFSGRTFTDAEAKNMYESALP